MGLNVDEQQTKREVSKGWGLPATVVTVMSENIVCSNNNDRKHYLIRLGYIHFKLYS